MYRNALRLPAVRLWPIAGCERAARKRRIRDMATPRRKRRHSDVDFGRLCVAFRDSNPGPVFSIPGLGIGEFLDVKQHREN